MLNGILSPEQIDALKRGVNGVSRNGKDGKDVSGMARPYDLNANRERIVRGQMPALEQINERFIRYLQLGLFDLTHRGVEVSSEPIKLQKCSDFIRHLVVPTNLNLITAKQLHGTALFAFDASLVFLVVDSMFGGDGSLPPRADVRGFTATEQRIAQTLLRMALDQYAKSWAPLHELEFEFLRSEMNPLLANIANPSETVVSTTYTLEFGGIKSKMRICFPYAMLDPLQDRLSNLTQDVHHLPSRNRWIRKLKEQLQDAEVELIALLANEQITLGDVLKLQKGDVIPLHIPETLMVDIDHTTLMECRYGQQAGRYALKVERFVGGNPASSMGETAYE